jgi:hypothetical protein
MTLVGFASERTVSASLPSVVSKDHASEGSVAPCDE